MKQQGDVLNGALRPRIFLTNDLYRVILPCAGTHFLLARTEAEPIDGALRRLTLGHNMNSAEIIRSAVARVASLREKVAEDPFLRQQLHWVKSFQSRRFAATYADLLHTADFGPAADFFLVELYGERDYSQRDAQFSRIARALQTYFPASVVQTAVSLAELHALTEGLDMRMAQVACSLSAGNLSAGSGAPLNPSDLYVACWREVGQESERMSQLGAVLALGHELDRLTRIRGLRMTLRMMRGPARATGLDALQSFLEAGFDTFADMSRGGDSAKVFLETIDARESAWIAQLFHASADTSAQALRDAMALP